MHRSLPFALAGVMAVVCSNLHAQNLLANPGFDQNLAGWAFGNYNPEWNPADASGSSHSGSVRAMVPGGQPQGGGVISQCVQVTGGAFYDFSLKARLQQTPGLQVGGYYFFASADCSGPFLIADSFHNVGGGQPNAWLTAHREIQAPAGAHSALVLPTATTRTGGVAHTVFFDDVYFGPSAPTICVANAQTLCLDYHPGDSRFLVRATYATVQSGGLQGNGTAISLSGLGVNRGGLFWFFSADNPEVLVKVLDGCGSTGFLWVFISAGTNVGVNLFIADTDTGAVALFHNPDLGPFPAIQNIFAIPCQP
jgi:hypothetical protein